MAYHSQSKSALLFIEKCAGAPSFVYRRNLIVLSLLTLLTSRSFLVGGDEEINVMLSVAMEKDETSFLPDFIAA
jgi:hypothetical protein